MQAFALSIEPVTEERTGERIKDKARAIIYKGEIDNTNRFTTPLQVYYVIEANNLRDAADIAIRDIFEGEFNHDNRSKPFGILVKSRGINTLDIPDEISVSEAAEAIYGDFLE